MRWLQAEDLSEKHASVEHDRDNLHDEVMRVMQACLCVHSTGALLGECTALGNHLVDNCTC